VAARILAGDIGGTKTNLALYEVEGGRRLRLLREASFSSREHPGLESVIGAFAPQEVSAAAFGIAGPVIGEVVETTNLPWRVDTRSVAAALGGARVRLLNDLEATAYGALFTPDEDLLVLQPGVPKPGNAVTIAAGTGLGEAFLFWDGTRHRPVASEGGHVDFAPRDDFEIELLRFLRGKFGRVSYERILSGPGLADLFGFLVQAKGRPVAPAVAERLRSAEDPSAVIGEAAVQGSCATCREAVDRFVRVYGAQAGNLALAGLAVAGVYVGGGIVTKILPRLEPGGFLEAFRDKGRYRRLVSEIPVRVLLNPRTPLLGAAQAARDLL
jgi:glucokinase